MIKKFEALGLEASMTSDGQLIIQSGFDTFTIDQANTDSSIMATIGLQYHQDLGGFAASSETTKATTTQIEEKTLSVANYAGYDTKMGLLNISDGTLSIYRNGEKATIQIKKDETFGDLRSRISSAFADVDLTFEDGYLKIFSKNPDDSIEVGATTDTSNFAAITGISSDGKTVSSARELYCVNSDSVIMNSGLFRRGDVTEGTFIVGDATFSISNTTTLAGLISQINSNDAANATAYWDSIDGKLEQVSENPSVTAQTEVNEIKEEKEVKKGKGRGRSRKIKEADVLAENTAQTVINEASEIAPVIAENAAVKTEEPEKPVEVQSEVKAEESCLFFH